MKTIKLLHIALFCITVTLLSCSFGIEDDGLMTKHVQLRVQASRGIYTEESNQKAPSNAESWKDGDKLYLASSTGVKGVATYGSKGWILDYSGNVSNAESCDLYYFENAEYHTDAKVGLNANSCVYFDSNAKLRNVDDEIILEGHLAPKNARFRFKANDGTEASITGFTYFSEFSVSTQGLTESNCVEEVKLVSKNGYTPYTYVLFNGNKQELTINANDCVFSRELTEKELSSGHSGYFVVPTKTNLNGWSFISEAPAPVWDGTKSSSFAGGSGTFADPYLIKTGGQLALMADYSNKNFKLLNNINLNDIAWKPIPDFSGYFDGNGNEIKNIKINRSEDQLGLFSKIRSGGTVCNVILRGVKIGATSRNYVGSIAGTNQGNITNSQVVFIEDSYIKGTSYVGGIVGESSDITSSLSCNLSQCQVISNNTGNDILGDKYVGGIAGFSRGYSWRRTEPIMTECIVSANVAGTDAVGGILGCAGESVRIWNCGFTGKLIGERNIGGIVGYCSPEVTRDDYNDITSCYAHVDITAGKDYVGGIIGGISYNQNHLIPINACYSDGTITVPATATYIGGIGGEAGDIFCCYSTVVCTNSNYCGIARRCDAISDCATVWNEVYGYCYGKKTNLYGNVKDNDIIEALQSSGSDYSGEFDFSKIWTWSGKVGGQNVTVKCPKLKWE